MNIIEFFKKKKKLSREEWLRLPRAKTYIQRRINDGTTQWPLIREENIVQIIVERRYD